MPARPRKHRSNPSWLRRHVTDPYVKAATQAGYRSRAAYKLIEIDERDHLLRPGLAVVDLGAAPGSWTQVVRERLRGRDGAVIGRIFALDLLPFEPLPEVEFIGGDFRDAAVAARLAEALAGQGANQGVDLVLSDMAPNLSGIAAVDAAASSLLAELAVEFAAAHLKSQGSLLVKAFQGSGYTQLVELLKKTFVSVTARKPPASRAESAEIYLLGRRPRLGGAPQGTK